MNGYVARIFTSFVDVPDKIAIAVYFSGCSIRCEGCHNKELWNKNNGECLSGDFVMDKIKNNKLAECVAFLGGEPTDQIDFLLYLCKRIKSEICLPITVYTGREFEDLPAQLLGFVDLIVCGPFVAKLKVENGWPASSNQRVFKKDGIQWKS